MKIEWERGWEKKLEKALAYPHELHVDFNQSEQQQLASLAKQYKKAGAEVPPRSQLRRTLSEIKKKAK